MSRCYRLDYIFLNKVKVPKKKSLLLLDPYYEKNGDIKLVPHKCHIEANWKTFDSKN